MANRNETKSFDAASKAIEDANYLMVPDEIHVYDWSPEASGTANVKSTQVHLHFGAPPGDVFVVRFKGPRTLDALIDALIEHREGLWGKRQG